jgi:hypothetical protein
MRSFQSTYFAKDHDSNDGSAIMHASDGESDVIAGTTITSQRRKSTNKKGVVNKHKRKDRSDSNLENSVQPAAKKKTSPSVQPAAQKTKVLANYLPR